MPAQNVKAIVKRYFTEFPEDNSKWKCRCGKTLTQKPNTGWSNLFQHIKSQPSVYLQDAQSTLQSFVVSKPASTKKAANIYSWPEWIGCGLKPFNFVENELTRKYRNLAPIAENTLKKFMEIVTKEVEVVIKTKLPNRFVLVIDGWSKSSAHFPPTAREHADLLALLEPMIKLKSVSLALQRDNITIADVNCLFEKVTSEFPCTKKYLDPMAPDRPIHPSSKVLLASCRMVNSLI